MEGGYFRNCVERLKLWLHNLRYLNKTNSFDKVCQPWRCFLDESLDSVTPFRENVDRKIFVRGLMLMGDLYSVEEEVDGAVISGTEPLLDEQGEEETENQDGNPNETEPDFYEVFLDADEDYQDLDDDDMGLKVLFRDRKRVQISLITKIGRMIRRACRFYEEKFGHWEEACVNVEDYFMDNFQDEDPLGLRNMFKTVEVVWSTPASRFVRDIVRLHFWLTVVAPYKRFKIFRDVKVVLSLIFLALILGGLCINVTGVIVVIVILILLCPVTAVLDKNYKNFFECYSEEEIREYALNGFIRMK